MCNTYLILIWYRRILQLLSLRPFCSTVRFYGDETMWRMTIGTKRFKFNCSRKKILPILTHFLPKLRLVQKGFVFYLHGMIGLFSISFYLRLCPIYLPHKYLWHFFTSGGLCFGPDFAVLYQYFVIYGAEQDDRRGSGWINDQADSQLPYQFNDLDMEKRVKEMSCL